MMYLQLFVKMVKTFNLFLNLFLIYRLLSNKEFPFTAFQTSYYYGTMIGDAAINNKRKKRVNRNDEIVSYDCIAYRYAQSFECHLSLFNRVRIVFLNLITYCNYGNTINNVYFEIKHSFITNEYYKWYYLNNGKPFIKDGKNVKAFPISLLKEHVKFLLIFNFI